MQPASLPVSRYPSRTAISAAIGARIAAAAREAVARCGRFTLAIAPAALDDDLVFALHRAALDTKFWEHTHLFWFDTDFAAHGDSPAQALELVRGLPMARRHLHLDVADEPNAIRAACNYEQMLRAFFGTDTGGVPQFDLIVTMLESAQAFAKVRHATNCDRLAVAAFDANRARHIVTLTPPLIANARALLMVAAGNGAPIEPIVLAAEAGAVRECLACPDQPDTTTAPVQPAASSPTPHLIETRVTP